MPRISADLQVEDADADASAHAGPSNLTSVARTCTPIMFSQDGRFWMPWDAGPQWRYRKLLLILILLIFILAPSRALSFLAFLGFRGDFHSTH